jgi:hypothetical protein
MKQQVHPVMIAVVVVVLVVGLGVWFVRAMQPAPYKPSPGSQMPVYAKAPGEAGSANLGTAPTRTPVVPPAGSRSGDPRSLQH